MVPVLFNRNPLVKGRSISQPSQFEIKNTLGLWNASLDDAVRYGGELTRYALKHMNLHHDRKHIIVDTKVHMLMPGWSPAIPGWHADGAPRAIDKNPLGHLPPDTFAQENDEHFNRYHILVTGEGCLTQYLNRPLMVDIPAEPSYEVYSQMSNYVQSYIANDPTIVSSLDSCTVYEFDWWNIHTGIIAKKKEWRFLIRVTESDYYEPNKDLREVIRMQSQVYSPTNFGW